VPRVTLYTTFKVKAQCHQMDNAVTRNESYLWNGKAYKLRIWYADGAQRPALAYMMTSKLKALEWLFKSPLAGAPLQATQLVSTESNVGTTRQ